MDMSSSPMATGSSMLRLPATSNAGGAHPPSDPTTWLAWAHHGHRLWAGMPEAFWAYVYKVHRCPQLSSHDWTSCPYAHKGERARRRDPRRFSYLAVPCPAFRESRQRQQLARTGAAPTCVHGLRCRYAHGVFELWLHPARFRTVLCEAGEGCRRRICFFAHSLAELRDEDDPRPLAGMPQPLPIYVPASPAAAPLTFPRRADLAMQAMPGKVGQLYNGGAGTSASSSSYPAVVAAPVPALPQGSPDDEEDPAESSRGASEDGDYPHFDLIRDMVNC
ncbi:hypothetical protein HU200_010037 [Digitaria exilis]|uniref:AtC3H23-like CCCH zinc finger domain-containing protein n=1 Tax=Digitaria exilis TaxID=1010633 RepID=A0A835KML3_9POAL|nr:hypothetical protein HU200_010037 [Digitaria exilis]